MDKKKGIRRLIALGSMSAFTLASFVTTTFAFVTLNTEATVSGFTFNISDQKGLLLSVDGNNFYQDIDADLIKKTILTNRGVEWNEDENDNDKYFKKQFSRISFEGVTLGKDNKAGIYSEEYSYKVGNYVVPIKDKRVTFVKDSLHKYTALEKQAIKDSSAYSAEYKARVADNDNFYGHEYQAATQSDYIFFDLWAMVADDTNSKKNFDLKFSSRTEITGDDTTEVTLVNKLRTPSSLDLRTADAERADKTKIKLGYYEAQDKIKVNPANAMRLGVTTLESSINTKNVDPTQAEMQADVKADANYVKSADTTITANKKYFVRVANDYIEAPVIEVGVTDVTAYFEYDGNDYVATADNLAANNKIYYLKNDANYIALSENPSDYYEYSSININIFEKNDGLGSYAVKGNTDGDAVDTFNRNPNLNAMYTYYNSLFPLAPFVDGVEDNGQLNTKHEYTNTVLGKFTYDSNTNDYNIVKMSVMVWLEGWDADYFAGISDASVGVKLGFEIVENND